MSTEAMKQALEALNEVTGWQWAGPMRVMDEVDDAITSLRQAITEAALEAKAENARELGLDYDPVAFKSPHQRWEDGDDHDPRSEAIYKFIADVDFKHNGDSFCFKSGGDGDNGETLMFLLDCWFASHPQPKREPLTDEEIEEIAKPFYPRSYGLTGFAREIEAAHGIKEKNT